jgi:hypothetical protein
MSDIQQIGSPNQRFFILLTSSEMRMSHWVTSAALWAAHPPRLLLEIGDWHGAASRSPGAPTAGVSRSGCAATQATRPVL